jgi:hypothetical protein
MGLGNKRNERCWCGSGRKYKSCHLGRENQTPIKEWEAEKALRDEFRVPVCSAPSDWHSNCSGRIIRAHTVPRAGSLNRIARDGHVYAFIPTIENLSRNNGILEPVLLGVRNASTFTGFCSIHDDAIFAPLEKAPFTATPEQCFLLGYRGMARERYTKQSSARMSPLRRLADRGKRIDRQVEIQMLNQLFEYGLAAALNDTQAQMDEYAARLKSGDYSDVRAYVIETVGPPPVMCSAGWLPSSDFEGTELQDIAQSKRLAAMSVTAMWGGEKGVVVFQWLAQDDDVCHAFVDSVARLSDDQIGPALVRLMFEHFENVHIAPAWWEALAYPVRTSLINRMARSANPFVPQLDKPLVDDGLALPKWPIAGRFTVGYAR